MSTPVTSLRTRRVRFLTRPAVESMARIRERLLAINEVHSVEAFQGGLEIIYAFPQTRFSVLQDIINNSCSPGAITPLHKFWYSLLSLLEDIEAENLSLPTGWNQYVEDIYVDEFQERRRYDNQYRNRLWQKYLQQKRPGQNQDNGRP